MEPLAGAVMELPVRVALSASGVFLLVGLLTGVWKYAGMARSSDAQAHPYVDIAHRASLLYSFAALVMAALAAVSAWPMVVDLHAVVWPLLFFALAIGTYVVHGWLGDTDNQLRAPHRLGTRRLPGAIVHGFMLLLVVAEVGGVAVLVAGAWCTLW